MRPGPDVRTASNPQWRLAMEGTHPKAGDYDFVEWTGRPHAQMVPPAKALHSDFDVTEVWLGNDRQQRYWTSQLGVTVYEIQDAIADTNTRCPTALREHLGR